MPDFSFNQLGLSFGLNTYYTGQFDNTFQGVDNFSKIVGRHTLKFGGDFRYFQLNIRAGCNPNGSFGFSGTQTGNDFADFLIGAVGAYAFLQCTPPALDTRGKFGSIYAQDSFKLKPNLILNYGLRWEFSPPWFDTQGRVKQIIWGRSPKIYPDSPRGWVFPGDPGVPNTLASSRYDNFAPRVGLAYSPGFADGILSKIFGGPGQTSIRAAFVTFYTAIEDLTMN
jgi:outer membrane receptor protein involved in Fe transport